MKKNNILQIVTDLQDEPAFIVNVSGKVLAKNTLAASILDHKINNIFCGVQEVVTPEGAFCLKINEVMHKYEQKYFNYLGTSYILYKLKDSQSNPSIDSDSCTLSAETESIFANNLVGIAFVKNNKFIRVNHALCDMLEYDTSQLMFNNVDLLHISDDHTKEFTKMKNDWLGETGEFDSEIMLKQSDGIPIWCRVYIKKSPRNPNIEIWIFMDITEQHNAEEDLENKKALLKEMNDLLEKKVKDEIEKRREQEQLLIQQSKMAAIGEMLGVIAHQWKQPLNSIYIMADLLEEDIPEDSPDYLSPKEFSEHIKESVRFMNSTMDDFRDFFRPSEATTVFCLKEALQSVIKLVAPSINKHRIKIHLHLPDKSKDYLIQGYENEFKQVAMNVIGNARDSIVELAEETPSSNYEINIELIEQEKHYSVCIQDNGTGIPEDIIDKIFEPYFTTKGEGGTGIGLYMSKIIIKEKLKGEIFAKNIQNGAEFCLKFLKY